MFRILVLVALFEMLPCLSAGATESMLFDELRKLSGPNASACGIVKLTDDASLAVECARAALAASKPFWFAAQYQGTDSSLWRGVALEPGKNNVWLISYDSDSHGGGGYGKESMNFGLCLWVKFSSSAQSTSTVEA